MPCLASLKFTSNSICQKIFSMGALTLSSFFLVLQVGPLTCLMNKINAGPSSLVRLFFQFYFPIFDFLFFIFLSENTIKILLISLSVSCLKTPFASNQSSLSGPLPFFKNIGYWMSSHVWSTLYFPYSMVFCTCPLIWD